MTGSESGIGEATKQLLSSRGYRVIGVDRHSAEVLADRSLPAGRAEMIEQVAALSGGHVDAVFANAG